MNIGNHLRFLSGSAARRRHGHRCLSLVGFSHLLSTKVIRIILKILFCKKKKERDLLGQSNKSWGNFKPCMKRRQSAPEKQNGAGALSIFFKRYYRLSISVAIALVARRAALSTLPYTQHSLSFHDILKKETHVCTVRKIVHVCELLRI